MNGPMVKFISINGNTYLKFYDVSLPFFQGFVTFVD